MRRFCATTFLVLLVCLTSFPPLTTTAAAAAVTEPEATRFTLRGRALDPTGAPIASASVTSVRDSGVPGPSATTDARGAFVLALDPGHYTITVTADGFAPASVPIEATRAGSASQDVPLTISGVRESVTVGGVAGYRAPVITSATKTATPLRDVPQSVTVVTKALIKDQLMESVGDVMRYIPGISVHQGENNRDQVIIRGNSSSADFFLDGVRDDVQYYRDLYNVDRVEALKGPNAMMFGRGGGGGVVNRVTKEAGFQPIHEFSLQGGSYSNKRFATDLDQPLSDKAAVRLNAMYENSDSFRDGVNLERYAINPTFTFTPGQSTTIVVGYEHLHDTRVADRGITSFQGKPVNVDVGTYYGNPSDSHVRADVDVVTGTIEHRINGLLLRNHTLVGNYDRGYQNYVPGAVSADQSQVTLTAYNNATQRLNVFNQTDATYALKTGGLTHTLLAGVEFGHQGTDNFRNTGYFNNTATSLLVPFDATTITTPVTFRQSATDADNHLNTIVAATYAQDQIELSRQVQVVAGVRFDHFDLTYHNNRTDDTLDRVDNLVSPRAGVVYKPIAPMSVFASYTISYLPSSGDQFSSLTTITEQVKPEKFTNYEVGVKWDVLSDLALTTSVYRLNRTNTRSIDPNDPTRIVQTGAQRTNGFEVGVNGHLAPHWNIAGGYAYQDAFVASATTTAAAGALVGQVPHHTFSLWNLYQFHPRVSAGLGLISRTDMFVAIDNTVRLPGYTRADAAVYYTVARGLRLQAIVENLFDTAYFINADSNTNISSGSPRAVRVGLSATF
jgi:catecholate siderophore receptor